ncbi:hypothetical protein LUZ60_014295 [Juncus effusus]|nr:hypothetical protein LUZ60_014295 [Juncus effusus]
MQFCNSIANRKQCPLLEEMNLEGASEICHDRWDSIGENSKNLRVLNANYTNVHDSDLMELAIGCHKLEILYIRGCFNVTKYGLKNFKLFRSDVEVKMEECLSISPRVSNPFA